MGDGPCQVRALAAIVARLSVYVYNPRRGVACDERDGGIDMRRIKALPLLAAGVLLGTAGCGSSSPAKPPTAASIPTKTADTKFPRPPVNGPVAAAVQSACSPDHSATIKQIKARGTLQWALGISPPFGFKDAQGHYAGVEVDNAAELTHILGVKVQLRDYDYGLLPPAITSGKADIIGAQLFITPVRAKVIDFSAPYYVSGQLFYVLKSSKWQTVAQLNTPSDHFVFGTGNAQEGVAKELIPRAKRSDAPLRGQALLYDFLATKRADSSMTEAQLMRPLLSKYTNPPLAAIGKNGRVTTLRPTDADLIAPFDVAFGLPKGDAGWKACVDAWVGDMKATMSIQKRIEYWLDRISA